MPAWLFRLLAPLMAEAVSVRMPLSNAKAKRELGWQLAHPTVSDGMRDAASRWTGHENAKRHEAREA
jgi:nucleoside-diphosphate-sugar epimerase